MTAQKIDHNEAVRICNLLWTTVNKTKTNIQELRSSHPDWDPETDIRISGFGKLQNAITATTFGIKFYTDNLLKPKWWNNNSSGYTSEDKKLINRAFMDFQRIGLIQVSFLAIESTIRSLLREVDPNACTGGTDPFKNIYECLIRTKLTGCNTEWCDFLDLWREVRNTIHNNGIYFSKDGLDKTVSFKGNAYKFYHKKKVDFVTWDMLSNIQRDACILLREIVDHDEVSSIGGTIQDLYA